MSRSFEKSWLTTISALVLIWTFSLGWSEDIPAVRMNGEIKPPHPLKCTTITVNRNLPQALGEMNRTRQYHFLVCYTKYYVEIKELR